MRARNAAQHFALQLGGDDGAVTRDQARGSLHDTALRTFDIHLQESHRSLHQIVETEGGDDGARVRQELPVVDQAAVGTDVRRVVGPSRRPVGRHGQQLHVRGVVQAQGRQQEPAILGVRLQGDDPSGWAHQSGGQQRVVPEVGADVDDGHAGRAVLLEHGGQMRLVVARQQAGGHGGVGDVAEQLHPADSAAHGVLLGQLDRECGRCHLMLNRAEHPADGRDPSEVTRGRLVDIGAEVVGQRRVQQFDELVVGDAPRRGLGHGAAQPLHDAVAQRLQLLLDGVLPGLVRLAHFGQRYPLARRPGR